ncbi:hypothetical protein [Dasania marina]|uniref:hypothetical protein n=1 Tax=Dasania marina TaxID=471499 RepID=UPI00035DC74E|nr:hypothetical protein [Dasania marina]
MRFLCRQHQAQTLNSPRQAISYWETWMADGQRLYQRGHWQQAHSYYGCSFEIGEWLLQQVDSNDHKNTLLNYAERMMLAGHSLAQCYKQLQHYSLQLDMLIRVHNQLSGRCARLIQQHWLLDNYLTISCNVIQQFGSREKSRPSPQQCQQISDKTTALQPTNSLFWADSH